MTIAHVAKQLHDMSVGGYFNREKFTYMELLSYIHNSFRDEVHLKNKNTLVMTIVLPDGEWWFTINHYNDRFDSFDYHIPETREQEANLIDILMKQKV